MTHDTTRETQSPVATRILSHELENVRSTILEQTVRYDCNYLCSSPISSLRLCHCGNVRIYLWLYNCGLGGLYIVIRTKFLGLSAPRTNKGANTKFKYKHSILFVKFAIILVLAIRFHRQQYFGPIYQRTHTPTHTTETSRAIAH